MTKDGDVHFWSGYAAGERDSEMGDIISVEPLEDAPVPGVGEGWLEYRVGYLSALAGERL